MQIQCMIIFELPDSYVSVSHRLSTCAKTQCKTDLHSSLVHTLIFGKLFGTDFASRACQ